MSRVWTRLSIGTGLVCVTAAVLLADVALARETGVRVAPGFWALLLGALLVGSVEFFRLLRRAGQPCRPVIGIVFVVVLVGMVFGETQFEPRLRPWLHERGLEMYLLLIVILVYTTFLAEIGRVERTGKSGVGSANGTQRAMAGVGWTVLAVLTVGLLGVFLAKIRFLSPDPMRGFVLLGLTLGTVKGADVGAYAIGSALGRHRLVPTLSPGKTIEGLAGALAAGTVAAVGLGTGWAGFAWWQMVLFGVAVSVSGVMGDLAESLLKRACGAKDSGSVPGFGGVLDIVDSMLAAAPVAYLVLVLLTRAPVAG